MELEQRMYSNSVTIVSPFPNSPLLEHSVRGDFASDQENARIAP